MADKENRTTESLRETLFDLIDKVNNRSIDISEAKAVCQIAEKIIQTADLELEAAKLYTNIDKNDLGISIGPYLLTSGKSKSE